MPRIREGGSKQLVRGKDRHGDVSKRESSHLNEAGPHPLREEDSDIT